MNEGMYFEGKGLLASFLYGILDFQLNVVGNKQALCDLTGTGANRTGFRSVHHQLLPYPLAGNLHNTELTEGKNGMFGAVVFHSFAHTLEQDLAVLLPAHVNEVNDNDASHIAEAQLAGYFSRGLGI